MARPGTELGSFCNGAPKMWRRVARRSAVGFVLRPRVEKCCALLRRVGFCCARWVRFAKPDKPRAQRSPGFVAASAPFNPGSAALRTRLER
jgi:hypothetical protein